MQQERKKRRPRHLRQRYTSAPTINTRDIEIFMLLWRARAMTREQIQLLFFSTRQAADRRLNKYFDHQYTNRKFIPQALGETGSHATMHLLGKAGAAELRKKGFDVHWYNYSPELTAGKLAHLRDRINFMVAIRVACKNHGFELEKWITENEVKADYDRVQVSMPDATVKTLPVVPDDVYTIIAYDLRHRVFAEVDEGTMTVARFQNKISAYIAYSESELPKARYGSKSMRVCTLVAGEKRLAQLKKATEQAGGKRRFWFALISDISPQTVFADPIWHVAGDTQKHSFFDLLQNREATQTKGH